MLNIACTQDTLPRSHSTRAEVEQSRKATELAQLVDMSRNQTINTIEQSSDPRRADATNTRKVKNFREEMNDEERAF